MALVLRGNDAVRLVQAVVVASALALLVTPVNGQVAPAGRQRYSGAATVSVATLKVPDQAWKHFEKARTLALKHEAAESERESAKALAIAPDFAAAHLMQASQQLVLHEFEAAIANVAAARKTDPDGQWAGVILVAAFNGLRRYDDATTELQALADSEASTWQAKYEAARTAIGRGDEEQALKLSAEALAGAPKSFSDAILVRTNALMLAHHWVEARECLAGYIAVSGTQTRKEQVQHAMVDIMQHIKAEETVNYASR